jgi:hypothetical protein
MNPASRIARLQGVGYCCFIGSKLQQLCCPSCTRSFNYFLGVYSSLAPMSSDFSSVSTRRLCFWSLRFTKLWIFCFVGILSSRNFPKNFLADPYFTQVSCRNTRCSKIYRTMMEHIAP